jgi:DNA-binding transcriptional ArsR family regulator
VRESVEVLEDAGRARSLLSPPRRAILESLDQPASAAELARRLEQPRQRVNYHLRELEQQALVELVEERRRGSVVECTWKRSAGAFAISPTAIGSLGGLEQESELLQDRFSSAFQIALASRALRDLARLRAGARAAKKKLPTFALETEVRFASAAARSAFAEELAATVATLVQRYHDEQAPRGRSFRFYLGAYPRPKVDS